MKNILYTFLILGFTITGIKAQTFSAFVDAADEAMAQNEFYSALKYYQEALEFEKDKVNVTYAAATAARLFNAFTLAESYYSELLEIDETNLYPEASYWLAEMKQKQGKYEEAIDQFNLYLSEQSGENEYLTQKAEKERKASEWAMEQVENPDSSVTLENVNAINTQFSETGALEKDGTLYFSSLRFPHPQPIDVRNPKYLSKVLTSENSRPAVELDEINEDLKLTAHTAFSHKSNRVYYTICDYQPNNSIKCDLYYREINSNGSYGEPNKLPDFINDEIYTTTHPAIGHDKETDKEILYFVSDRPGGKGKFDIWYSVIDDNMNMTRPMNVEDVNTAENDISPFFHIPSHTLYFSSQGYRSLGGYDIYRSEKINGKYGEVEALEFEVNSSYDDIFYTLSNDMLTGYFSTNREGSQFIDDPDEACCFDIYKAKYEPVLLDLNVSTCEEIAGNQKGLNGATVELIDAKTGEVVQSVTSPASVDHRFELERNKDYLIVASKEYYFPDTVTLSTYKIYKSQTFDKTICLKPESLVLKVLMCDDATQEDLEGVTLKMKDLTDNTIQDVELTNMDGNDFEFTVYKGHEYELTATKQNYTTKIDIVDTEVAEIQDGVITHRMCLNFGPMYLPLSLYFDNDRPDPRTTSKTTRTLYSKAFEDYYARLDVYKDRAPDSTAIKEFFEVDVKGGNDTLNIFLNGMKSALESGKSLEITIQGYTSPVSTSAYNLYLGQRRVESVKNEIEAFDEGSLIPFMEEGKLKITDISYGETLAPKDVSDSSSDIARSIYSVEASKERRVEIIQVNVIVNN